MRRSCHLAAAALAAIVLFGSGAAAEDRAVVFVHGMKSSGSTWQDAARRLQAVLAISPSTPSLSSLDIYETQATQLQSLLGTLPNSAIAVGHSNGGIVSRQWSRRRHLGGIVTLGTPHGGAPLAAHMADWAGMNFEVFSLVGAVSSAFGVEYDDWSWVYDAIQGALAWATGIGQDSLLMLAGTLGYQLGTPVLPEMVPGGPFLASLNGSSNVGREATAVDSRVGITNVAANFYTGGVYRAIAPDSAEYLSGVMYAAAILLDAYATQLASTGIPAQADRAVAMWNLAGWLLNHEEFWCRTVSDPTPYAYTSAGLCLENDSVVPAWSQRYPGALNLVRRNSPVHINEAAQSDDVLYQVLTTYMQVAGRGAGTPQPPPPDSYKMIAGQELRVSQRITSKNAAYYLLYQGDGNLVLYKGGSSAVWASRTAGQSVGRVLMQSDGNLVMYNANGSAVWASNTNRNPGAYAALTDDGKVVVYSSSNTVLWAAPSAPTTPPPTTTTGRYKLDGSGKCYWDPNDTGPNQCTPSTTTTTTGRYKVDGSGKCYWDPNDTGPNQCTP